MAMTTGSTGQAYSEINMTPLIDVMLVLLIIFITLPNQTDAIKIDNPWRSPPTAEPPEVINLQNRLTAPCSEQCRSTARPAVLYQRRSTEIAAARSAHRSGQIRKLRSGGADLGICSASASLE